MKTKIIETYKEFEEMLRYEHKKGNKVGIFSENDLRYERANISTINRINDVKNHTNIIGEFYITNYATFSNMSKTWMKRMPVYYNRYSESPESVYKHRKNIIDYFINIPKIQYEDKSIIWVRKNIQNIPSLEKIDAISLVRGCFGAEVYISLNYKEKVDYISICPFKLPFVVVIYELLKLYGINAGFPKDINIKECLNPSKSYLAKHQ